MTNATSAVTATSIASSSAGTASATTQVAGNMKEFLGLLTTQLKNQDPMNPMDSTQFTQQLVEYSQVEQQINTNSKLDTLNQLGLNQSLSLALGYVGKDINYTSADLSFDGTDKVNISYNLPSVATNAVASIRDANGNVVYTQPVSTTAGMSNFHLGRQDDGRRRRAGRHLHGRYRGGRRHRRRGNGEYRRLRPCQRHRKPGRHPLPARR